MCESAVGVLKRRSFAKVKARFVVPVLESEIIRILSRPKE
jgi:hypothetical protein